MHTGIKSFSIQKYWSDDTILSGTKQDPIPIESPLQMTVYSPKEKGFRELAITMRTPGEDQHLVLGFFLAENIITQLSDVKKILQIDDNIMQIILAPHIDIDAILQEKRNFVVSSSCGICGDISLKDKIVTNHRATSFSIGKEIIFQLANRSSAQQDIFKHTGGLHAATLFSSKGEVIHIKEDVGRHNALDKLVGFAIKNEQIPLNNHILLLSGRISYELIQKTATAGIFCICALGAPSSLAVETAKDLDLMLIGFITEKKFNVYSKSSYINIKE